MTRPRSPGCSTRAAVQKAAMTQCACSRNQTLSSEKRDPQACDLSTVIGPNLLDSHHVVERGSGDAGGRDRRRLREGQCVFCLATCRLYTQARLLHWPFSILRCRPARAAHTDAASCVLSAGQQNNQGSFVPEVRTALSGLFIHARLHPALVLFAAHTRATAVMQNALARVCCACGLRLGAGRVRPSNGPFVRARHPDRARKR